MSCAKTVKLHQAETASSILFVVDVVDDQANNDDENNGCYQRAYDISDVVSYTRSGWEKGEEIALDKSASAFAPPQTSTEGQMAELTLDVHAKVDSDRPHAVNGSAVVLPLIPKGHRFYPVNTGVGDGICTG